MAESMNPYDLPPVRNTAQKCWQRSVDRSMHPVRSPDVRAMTEKARVAEGVQDQAEALVRFAFRSLGYEVPSCLR